MESMKCGSARMTQIVFSSKNGMSPIVFCLQLLDIVSIQLVVCRHVSKAVVSVFSRIAFLSSLLHIWSTLFLTVLALQPVVVGCGIGGGTLTAFRGNDHNHSYDLPSLCCSGVSSFVLVLFAFWSMYLPSLGRLERRNFPSFLGADFPSAVWAALAQACFRLHWISRWSFAFVCRPWSLSLSRPTT